jgi:hypothetical protein
MAREYKEACKTVEPWFKTCYAKEDIPKEWRQRWRDPEVKLQYFLFLIIFRYF